jgi:hypothetical protein
MSAFKEFKASHNSPDNLSLSPLNEQKGEIVIPPHLHMLTVENDGAQSDRDITLFVRNEVTR